MNTNSNNSNQSNNWQTIKRGKKKSPQKLIETDQYPKTLKGFFDAGYCVFHFMGRCNNGTDCQSKHMEDNIIFKQLQKILLDPIKIPQISNNRSNIISFIKQNTAVGEYKMEPFLTSCYYSIRNIPCNNMKEKRFVKYEIKFNQKNIGIYICYPEKKTCKTRVTCGFHFDVEYSFKHNQFHIENIISNEDEQPSIKKEKKEEKKEEKLSPAESILNFPELKSKKQIKKEKEIKVEEKKIKKKEKPQLPKEEPKEEKENEKKVSFLDMAKSISKNENNKQEIIVEIDIHQEIKDIDSKTKDQLKELLKKVIDNNKKLSKDNEYLMKRNAELGYLEFIGQLPIPVPQNNHKKNYYDDDDIDENQTLDDDDYDYDYSRVDPKYRLSDEQIMDAYTDTEFNF